MIIQNSTNWILLILCILLLSSGAMQGRQYHVSAEGDDTDKGTAGAPFQTISKAAEVAQPGDVITVHEGTYRERINPPRGGRSGQKRIVYHAAPGQKVIVKGSEVIKGWQKVQNDTWKVNISNSFFGDFNPYSDLIGGDWFNPKGRDHHTGAVYLNDHWLTEASGLDDVVKPIGKTTLWFGQVDEANTTIWAQFRGINPNEAGVEINVRQAVFYPDRPGVNFITVSGLTMMHAATPWAPPTAEQIGLIGTHWSKGWIIENMATNGTTLHRILQPATSRPLSVPWQTAGRRKISVIMLCGTTAFRIASRRVSSEAWARSFVPSPATSFMISISGNCLQAPKWPASRFTALLTL